MSVKRSCNENEEVPKNNKIQRKFDLWKNDDITITPLTTPNSTKNSNFGFNMWENRGENDEGVVAIKISDLKIGLW